LLDLVLAWVWPSRAAPASSDWAAELARYPLARFQVLWAAAGPLQRPAQSRGQPLRFRVFTDEPQERGRRLELELLLPEAAVAVLARVDWVEALAGPAPARFLVGLQILAVRRGDENLIARAFAGAPEPG
jgi:hypothetical protein